MTVYFVRQKGTGHRYHRTTVNGIDSLRRALIAGGYLHRGDWLVVDQGFGDVGTLGTSPTGEPRWQPAESDGWRRVSPRTGGLLHDIGRRSR